MLKIKLLLCLCTAAPFLLIAQPAKKLAKKPVVKKTAKFNNTPTDKINTLTLSIEAKGFADSTVAVLLLPNNQNYQGPYAYVKNEKVVLMGTLPHADLYILLFTDGKNRQNDKYFNTFLSNETSQIIAIKSTNQLQVIKGNTLFAFDDLIKNFSADFNNLTQINQQIQGLVQEKAPIDSMNKVFELVKIKVAQNLTAFLKKNNNSPVSAYLLNVCKQLISLPQVDSNLALLSPLALSNPTGQQLQAFVEGEKATGQGQPAPAFTQNDTLGKPISLSDFRGKYVLVDFWASWCGPCRQENPNVVTAFNTYKNKNFTVLGISLDRDKNKWLQAIKDDSLSWTHVSDLKFWKNEVALQYKVQSIPQNFLIGPDGKIVAKNLRGGVLQSYLQQLLK